MNKYTKIVPFDVGTERPTEEYVRKLEAVVEVANHFVDTGLGLPSLIRALADLEDRE